MPTKALKPCSWPGCPNLVKGGRCSDHRKEQDERPSAARRGYGRKWQAYSKWFLSQHPVCACGCGGKATDVDHIIPVSGPDDPLFWARDNHQALAHECHTRKTNQERGDKNLWRDLE